MEEEWQLEAPIGTAPGTTGAHAVPPVSQAPWLNDLRSPQPCQMHPMSRLCRGENERSECYPEKHWANHLDFRNHSIHSFITESGFHMWACDRCKSWAEFVPRFLGGYCLAQPTKANMRDYELILDGKHPQYPNDRIVEVSHEQVMTYRLDHARLAERAAPKPAARASSSRG